MTQVKAEVKPHEDTGSFTCLPDRLLAELTGPEIKVYWAILRRDRGQGCWASWKTLAADTGLSRDAVRRTAAGLISQGLLTSVQRTSEHGDPETNLLRCQVVVRDWQVVDLRVGAADPPGRGENAPTGGGKNAPTGRGENAPGVGEKMHPKAYSPEAGSPGNQTPKEARTDVRAHPALVSYLQGLGFTQPGIKRLLKNGEKAVRLAAFALHQKQKDGEEVRCPQALLTTLAGAGAELPDDFYEQFGDAAAYDEARGGWIHGGDCGRPVDDHLGGPDAKNGVFECPNGSEP